MRNGPNYVESCARQKVIIVLIENLLDQEEMVWFQGGRANWLMGIITHLFFHHAATVRKKRKQIKKLLDETGVW